MVVKLTGKVDGAEVIFQRNAAGQWETTVPANPKGSYAIELWAEDEAGNRAYFATVKVTFDTSQMCMTFEILDVGAGWSVFDVQSVLGITPVTFAEARTEVRSTASFASVVLSKIVKCEVCGR